MYIYYVCFMFVKWWGLWIDVPKFFSCIQSINTGFVYYIYEKNFEMCLWPEFDWYKVTLCGWQDIKIQLLTNLPLFWFFIHMSESRTVHAKSRCELSLKRMILDKILTEIMVMAKNFKLMITIAAQHEEQACFLVLKPMWSKRPTFVTRTILHTHALHTFLSSLSVRNVWIMRCLRQPPSITLSDAFMLSCAVSVHGLWLSCMP